MKNKSLAQALKIPSPIKRSASLAIVKSQGVATVEKLLAFAVARGAFLPGIEPAQRPPRKSIVKNSTLIAAMISLRAPSDSRLLLAGGQLMSQLRFERERIDLINRCMVEGSVPVCTSSSLAWAIPMARLGAA